MDSAGINASIALVQKVISLGKKANNLDFAEALMAAREALLAQKEENINLREEKSALQALVSKQRKILPEKNHEWLIDAEDKDVDRRYCPLCFYDRDKLIPLDHPYTSDEGETTRYCKGCSQDYE